MDAKSFQFPLPLFCLSSGHSTCICPTQCLQNKVQACCWGCKQFFHCTILFSFMTWRTASGAPGLTPPPPAAPTPQVPFPHRLRMPRNGQGVQAIRVDTTLDWMEEYALEMTLIILDCSSSQHALWVTSVSTSQPSHDRYPHKRQPHLLPGAEAL